MNIPICHQPRHISPHKHGIIRKMAERSKEPESPKQGRSSEDLRSQSTRSPNLFLAHLPSPSHTHRQSFGDQFRGPPPSPRSQRQSSISISQALMQALLNDPPTAGSADAAFAGRDWREITVSELVKSEDLRWVEVDTGVETATSVRIHVHYHTDYGSDMNASFSSIPVHLLF